MATYKVIQDIEAEDKLLGPLTLRQFVYASIVIVMGFIAFKLATLASPFYIIPFILPMGFFTLLAAPFGHDQSSEVWLLAKIGFMLKPRRRIWDQSGVQELVTITVPKRVEKHLTDGLTQMEVKSRLQALANTIDSRGWAIKNVNVNLYNQPSYLSDGATSSDRLVDGSSLPQDVPNTEVLAADDILDEANNPTAQHLDAMISQAEQSHRKTMVATVQNGQQPAAPPADYWFMNQPTNQPPAGYAAFDSNPVVTPGSSAADQTRASDKGAAEQALLEKIHEEKAKPNPAYAHMRVLDPSGKTHEPHAKSHEKKHKSHSPKAATHSSKLVAGSEELGKAKAAISRLAANNDLNVATIAREADKATQQTSSADEVIISLR